MAFEAVGLTAAIGSILKALGSAYTVVHGISQSRHEAQDLANQLEAASCILTSLISTLKAIHRPQEFYDAWSGSTGVVLDNIKITIDKLNQKFRGDARNIQLNLWERIRWPFARHEMLILNQQLQGYLTMLGLVQNGLLQQSLPVVQHSAEQIDDIISQNGTYPLSVSAVDQFEACSTMSCGAASVWSGSLDTLRVGDSASEFASPLVAVVVKNLQEEEKQVVELRHKRSNSHPNGKSKSKKSPFYPLCKRLNWPARPKPYNAERNYRLSSTSWTIIDLRVISSQSQSSPDSGSLGGGTIDLEFDPDLFFWVRFRPNGLPDWESRWYGKCINPPSDVTTILTARGIRSLRDAMMRPRNSQSLTFQTESLQPDLPGTSSKSLKHGETLEIKYKAPEPGQPSMAEHLEQLGVEQEKRWQPIACRIVLEEERAEEARRTAREDQRKNEKARRQAEYHQWRREEAKRAQAAQRAAAIASARRMAPTGYDTEASLSSQSRGNARHENQNREDTVEPIVTPVIPDQISPQNIGSRAIGSRSRHLRTESQQSTRDDRQTPRFPPMAIPFGTDP